MEKSSPIWFGCTPRFGGFLRPPLRAVAEAHDARLGLVELHSPPPAPAVDSGEGTTQLPARGRHDCSVVCEEKGGDEALEARHLDTEPVEDGRQVVDEDSKQDGTDRAALVDANGDVEEVTDSATVGAPGAKRLVERRDELQVAAVAADGAQCEQQRADGVTTA